MRVGRALNMCSIIGYHFPDQASKSASFISALYRFLSFGKLRGRDGFGYALVSSEGLFHSRKFVPRRGQSDEVSYEDTLSVYDVITSRSLISNHRAEPTTEYVPEKSEDDQQPYTLSDWSIVHNGMIANDKDVFRSLSFTPPGGGVDSWAVAAVLKNVVPVDDSRVWTAIQSLRGAMALGLLYHAGGYEPQLYLYRDFEPLYLWWIPRESCYVFSSIADSAQECFGPEVCEIYVPPYSMVYDFRKQCRFRMFSERRSNGSRAVVVTSGGLDSTTASKIATLECEDVTLLHCLYGCQAEKREAEAVRKVASSLGCRAVYVDMGWMKSLGGPLLDTDCPISDPIAGAEYFHEWVHARNTAMIGMAAAYCDCHDIGRIYLGLNLEEAGAYPDNTTEFYRLFERVLDCGTRSRPRIINPCANLTKKEIVELALRIGAPIQYSWSCYRGGELHCGRCGPCYMRRTAFRMLGREDVISYASG